MTNTEFHGTGTRRTTEAQFTALRAYQTAAIALAEAFEQGGESPALNPLLAEFRAARLDWNRAYGR